MEHAVPEYREVRTVISIVHVRHYFPLAIVCNHFIYLTST